jgi:hypothetical protein
MHPHELVWTENAAAQTMAPCPETPKKKPPPPTRPAAFWLWSGSRHRPSPRAAVRAKVAMGEGKRVGLPRPVELRLSHQATNDKGRPMNEEFPKPFIPDTRNYAREIAERLDGQDRALELLAGLAKETTALLSALTKQQQDHALLLAKIADLLAARQPPQ